jgi:hypothetical protein
MRAIVRLPDERVAQDRAEISVYANISRRKPNIVAGEFDEKELAEIESEGGQVYPDVQFQLASTDIPFLPDRKAARFWEIDYSGFIPADEISLDSVLAGR